MMEKDNTVVLISLQTLSEAVRYVPFIVSIVVTIKFNVGLITPNNFVPDVLRRV